MPLTSYPGVAQLTVNTSGSGGPGVLVSSGSGDAHGWFPVPQEAQGGDLRSAADLMTGIENLTDRTNWIAWRIPDWIAGGDYRSLYRAEVQFGNAWYLDRSWSSGTEATVQIFGPTGGGNATLDVSAGGGNGCAIRATATGNSPAVNGVGTVQGTAKTGTNTPGGSFTGDGTGAGCVGVGGSSGIGGDFTGHGGEPAVIARSAPIQFGQSIASSSTAPGVGCCWPQSFDMASGNISSDGVGGYTVNRGLNIASVAHATSIGQAVVRVTFTQAMSTANYATTVNLLGNALIVQPWTQTTTYVEFLVTSNDGSHTTQDPASVALNYMFRVSLD